MSKGLKVFDKVGDGLKVNFDGRPTKEYIKYLNNYDTSNLPTTVDVNNYVDTIQDLISKLSQH